MSMIEEPIFQKTLIRADIEEVFRAIATAKGLDEWFTKGSILEDGAGGRIEFVWKEWGPEKVNYRSGGPILEYNPPKRFVYKWGSEPQSTVEIDLEEFEGGTLITARETGYINNEDGWARCLDCASGWGEALTLLKFYLEHGLTY